MVLPAFRASLAGPGAINTAACAVAALATAPSLRGRTLPENHAAALAALGDRETEVSELAVAQWCVAELKGSTAAAPTPTCTPHSTPFLLLSPLGLELPSAEADYFSKPYKSSCYSPNVIEQTAHCDHKPLVAWVFVRLLLHRRSAAGWAE